MTFLNRVVLSYDNKSNTANAEKFAQIMQNVVCNGYQSERDFVKAIGPVQVSLSESEKKIFLDFANMQDAEKLKEELPKPHSNYGLSLFWTDKIIWQEFTFHFEVIFFKKYSLLLFNLFILVYSTVAFEYRNKSIENNT